MRLPRGRTPTPVERRLVPTSASGIGQDVGEQQGQLLDVAVRVSARARGELEGDVVVRAVGLEADVLARLAPPTW